MGDIDDGPFLVLSFTSLNVSDETPRVVQINSLNTFDDSTHYFYSLTTGLSVP